MTGDFVAGNGAVVSVGKIPGGAVGSNGNLTVGGNIMVGSDKTSTGSTSAKITVDDTLTLTGSNKTVAFYNGTLSTDVSRLHAGKLAMGNNADITITGGDSSAFTVLKASVLGGSGTTSVLRLDGKAMSFVEGVTLSSGATIMAVSSGTEMYLGEYRNIPADNIIPTAGKLTLDGGTLDGSQATLSIAPKAALGGSPISGASMEVIGDSTIKGSVATALLDATITTSGKLRVHAENGRSAWNVQSIKIDSGGELIIGTDRTAAQGGMAGGIVRIIGDGAAVTVASGGVVRSVSYDYSKTSVGTNDQLEILKNTNIIGSGRTHTAPVNLNMSAGSTLDLSGGSLFLDNTNATIDGAIVFGGLNSGTLG